MKYTLAVTALLCLCFVFKPRNIVAQGSKTPIFRDDFEYDVSRDAKNAEVAFRAHGWTDAKANNTHFQRGAGYLYTQYDPILKSRVLVMESLPSQATTPPGGRRYAQTDYWLKYGEGDKPLTTIPANVWFQFWTYATPSSRFYRLKFLYPSRGSYPASRRDGRTDYMWLFGFRGSDDRGVEGPPGSRFLAFEAWHADFRGHNDPSQRTRMVQNLAPRTPLLAGRWYQVRIHIDVSGEQGVYEAWVREKDEQWKKVAEWKGGVTRDFFWHIPVEERVGLRVLAMPTTVNAEDSKMYLDQFVMASSEKDLP